MDTKKITIGVIALAIIGVAAWQFTGSDVQDTDTAMKKEESVDAMEEESHDDDVMMEEGDAMEDEDGDDAMEIAYVDGTYTALGNYTSPAQEEEVEITLTIEDGVVTAAEFDGKATHEISQKVQGLFAEGFEEEVVGVAVDEIDLDVVNGSSLTPTGFMDALDAIKEEAQG